MGHAEPNLELFRAFRTVNAPGAVLYQKSRAAGGWPPGSLPSPPDRENLAPPARSPAVGCPPAPLVGAASSSAEPVPPPPPSRREASDRPPAAPPALPEMEPSAPSPTVASWSEPPGAAVKVLARNKLEPVVYFYQALVLEQMGRHAESEHALRRAIYLDRQLRPGPLLPGPAAAKATGTSRQAGRSFRNVLQLLARVDAGPGLCRRRRHHRR